MAGPRAGWARGTPAIRARIGREARKVQLLRAKARTGGTAGTERGETKLIQRKEENNGRRFIGQPRASERP